MGGSAFINGVEYPELDNFYVCKNPLEWEGISYKTSEALYQALKFDKSEQKHKKRSKIVLKPREIKHI